ncbi:TetR/AcrR family transcriptional regulator [Nonomuraea sp. NPDC050153]|uniref:TetR/AcrR family transcriptional regulator n=1 Tax=Nonomuraea sp. NPDC050153 TaxID=3364359 RepID=UPI0037BC883B
MRADARRNLDKIVEAAAEIMAERGVDAPMEAVAKRAGVGVGTLYRRFPDRNALIAAVGDHYVHTMADALDLAASSASDAWSAIWDFVTWAAEPGRAALATALAVLPDEVITGREEFARARARWVERFDALVRRAQAEGSMRTDVGVDDLIHLLNVFACHPGRLPEPVASRPVRYLHLMLDGMKTGAATPSAHVAP